MAFEPEISSFSFALQRTLLVIDNENLDDFLSDHRNHILFPSRTRLNLLNRSVETRPNSWERGLNRIQWWLLNTSDQGHEFQETCRANFVEMRWTSLEIAIRYEFPHLVKFEAEKYWKRETTWRDHTQSISQLDWRQLLVQAFNGALPHGDDYGVSVGIFHLLLNCINLQEDEGTSDDLWLRLHEEKQKRLNTTSWDSSPQAFLKILHRIVRENERRELDEMITLRLQNMPRIPQT